MNTKNRVGFVLVGFIIWLAGTSLYWMAGPYFFEGSATAYWLNLMGTSILSVAIFIGFMKWQRIWQKDWLQGAICIALPGMLGEIPILAGFSELMGNMEPETAGLYAAFLFGVYSSVLGFAGLMSIKASSQRLVNQHQVVKMTQQLHNISS